MVRLFYITKDNNGQDWKCGHNTTLAGTMPEKSRRGMIYHLDLYLSLARPIFSKNVKVIQYQHCQFHYMTNCKPWRPTRFTTDLNANRVLIPFRSSLTYLLVFAHWLQVVKYESLLHFNGQRKHRVSTNNKRFHIGPATVAPITCSDIFRTARYVIIKFIIIRDVPDTRFQLAIFSNPVPAKTVPGTRYLSPIVSARFLSTTTNSKRALRTPTQHFRSHYSAMSKNAAWWWEKATVIFMKYNANYIKSE